FEWLLRAGYQPSRSHYGLGRVAEARGDTAGALREYRKALQLEPGFDQARQALARLGG
ncbi:MAG: Tetratricopeptide repeat, partial [Acidobacteria bacterium]|nr:Tetratricopeptide repeat [Acidobacteriota bacterium]